MQENWLDIGKAAIFRDKSKGGYLFLFLKDYQEHFGGSLYPSCNKCLNKYWENYTKSLLIMEEKKHHGYVLKLKYNGISLRGYTDSFRNGDLTEEQAERLLREHPHGAELFDEIPKKKKRVVRKKLDTEKEVKKYIAKKKPVKKSVRKSKKSKK